MSMWQYMAAIDGYMAAHGGEQDGLSGQEVDDLWDWLQER